MNGIDGADEIAAGFAALDCDGDARLTSIHARRRDEIALTVWEQLVWRACLDELGEGVPYVPGPAQPPEARP